MFPLGVIKRMADREYSYLFGRHVRTRVACQSTHTLNTGFFLRFEGWATDSQTMRPDKKRSFPIEYRLFVFFNFLY